MRTDLHNVCIGISFISTSFYLKLNSIPFVEILRFEVWRLRFFFALVCLFSLPGGWHGYSLCPRSSKVCS